MKLTLYENYFTMRMKMHPTVGPLPPPYYLCIIVTYRLAEQQSGLESNISKEEVDMRIKEDSLGNILPTLEGIRKATLPLQESLGIPLDKMREEQDMALLLPS